MHESLQTVYGQYFPDSAVTVIAIYILTIIIVIFLLIEVFVMAMKLVPVEKFIAPKIVMASRANMILVAFMRVVIIKTLEAV